MRRPHDLTLQDSTWPRPRQEVEKELETAAVFDLPLLVQEIALAQHRITDLERDLGPAEAPCP